MAGIIRLYESFRESLKENQDEIAVLLMSGLIENYFLYKFASHVHETDPNLLVITNCGLKKQQKIDAAIAKGNYIKALIEFKHLPNLSRSIYKKSQYDISGPLNKLSEQVRLVSKKRKTGGYHKLRLWSKNRYVYGLVIASYVRPEEEEDKAEVHYKKIEAYRPKKAKYLKYYDGWVPKLDKENLVDTSVNALGTEYKVTLRTGIWVPE